MTHHNLNEYLASRDQHELLEEILKDDYLLNHILLAEDSKKGDTRKIIVYPGRLQPFHRGHYEVYKYLVSAFSQETVYIVTQDLGASGYGLTFEEKLDYISQMYDIDPSLIVQTNNPYKPPEILSKYDSTKTALVVAISVEEEPRFEHDKYFKDFFDVDQHISFNTEAYYYVYNKVFTDKEKNPITEDSIRQFVVNPANTEDAKKRFLEDAMGKKLDRDMYGLLMQRYNKPFVAPEVDASTFRAVKTPMSLRPPTEDRISKYASSFLNDTVYNPETKRNILVKSAMQYDTTHPAKINAMNYLKQKIKK